MKRPIFSLFITCFVFCSASAQVTYDSLDQLKSLAYSYPDSVLEIGETILQSEAVDSIKANTLSLMSVTLRLQGRFEEAILLADSAITYRNKTVNASAFLNKAVCERYFGNYNEAAALAIQSLKIYDELGDQYSAATALNNIGVIYMYMEDYGQAQSYYERALQIHKDQNNLKGQAEVLNNMAIVMAYSGDLDASESFFRKSGGIEKSLDNKKGISECINNIGSVKQMKGEIDSAIYYFQQSLAIDKALGDQQGVIEVMGNIGKTALEANQIYIAKQYLDSALEQSLALGTKYDIQTAYLNLTDYYQAINEFDVALDHYITAMDYKDSLINEKRVEVVADLEAKYETAKKEKQIAEQQVELAEKEAALERNLLIIAALLFLLISVVLGMLLWRSSIKRKQNQVLQEANLKLKEAEIEAAIKSQEQERKRFARDLHDGFGQMISVLNLNLRSLEKNAPQREEIFEHSTKVLEDMYKELKGICFNLMPETLIRQGIVPALQEFADRINRTGHISVLIDHYNMDDRLEDLQEISLYRIVQEWVNNILKYANADQITISLTRDDAEITLLIEDNGIGFDKRQLFEGKGNGWKNLQTRANLLKGELELDTTEGLRGSTLILNAPYLHTYIENSAKDQVIA